MLGAPPPVPSRLSQQRMAAAQSLPQSPAMERPPAPSVAPAVLWEGHVVASLGPMPFLRTTARVTSENALAFTVEDGEVVTVALAKAVVRLEEVLTPYHVLIVPRPGSIIVPNLRIDPVCGEPELRRALYDVLASSTHVMGAHADAFKRDGTAFEPIWRAPAMLLQVSIKRQWFSRGRSMKIRRIGDDVVVWELRGHKGAFKSVELLPVLEQGADATPCLFGSESVVLPIKAYALWARWDDYCFLPWLAQVPLADGRRTVAVVSRPWLARSKSYEAEVRFPRSMGTFLPEPDVVVVAADQDAFSLVLACTNAPLASVTVLSKGRYKVDLSANCGFPTQVLLMLVLLVDKVVHDPSSFCTVSNVTAKTQVGNVTRKLTSTALGGKILDALDL